MKIWYFGEGRLPGEVAAVRPASSAAEDISQPYIARFRIPPKCIPRYLHHLHNAVFFDPRGGFHSRYVIPIGNSLTAGHIDRQIEPFAGRGRLEFKILLGF